MDEMSEDMKVHNMKYRCLELAVKVPPTNNLSTMGLAKEMYAWVIEKKE